MPRSAATDTSLDTSAVSQRADYELPFVHLRVPQRVGDAAFWLGAAGAVIGGMIELPVAAMVAGAVIVGRHRSNRD
ncbi:MAG: hypothetical protein ACP5P1_11470 [Acidimicrobiales bacterium]